MNQKITQDIDVEKSIEYNKAAYTVAPVACCWAGAVRCFLRLKLEEYTKKVTQLTDRPTDRQSDL